MPNVSRGQGEQHENANYQLIIRIEAGPRRHTCSVGVVLQNQRPPPILTAKVGAFQSGSG